ncbi:MAG: hypothetical protein GXP27_09820 [Planctomycetes bacterium]|nr:hypothetical protein [Planctomycetota bacterium]
MAGRRTCSDRRGLLHAVLGVIGILLLASPQMTAVAPADDAPSVTVMHAGADVLLKDLQFLSSLTTPKEQSAWKKIIDKEEGVLEIFLLGIDRARPMQLDILLGNNTQRFRMYFPISDFELFESENLGGFDIQTKKIATNFFQLSGGGYAGFLRYLHKYAIIAESRDDLPAELNDPAAVLKPLLEKHYSVAVDIRNAAAGREARLQSMAELRKNLSDAIKRKATETEAEFALRKAAFDAQMDELERFFVDASQITLGIVLDYAKRDARLDINLQAIPDTPLANDIQALNQRPSYFASLKKSDSAIFFGKLNFPLTEMRQANLLKQFEYARIVAAERVQKDESRSADQKKKAVETIDAFYDLLVDGTKKGVLDGFIEIRQDEAGRRVFLAANQAPDGTRMRKVLQLYAQSKTGRAVEFDVATVAEVKIHRLQPSRELEGLTDFLGDRSAFYVGTSEDVIWYATGHDALNQLKATITKWHEGRNASPNNAESPSTDGTFAEMFIKSGAWFQYLDERRKKREAKAPPKKLTATEKAAKQEREKLLRLALEACQTGDDTVSGHLKRVGDHVEGEVRFGESLLRLVSKIVADFANENL